MKPVTRSMEATSSPAAARVARQRRSQPSGWWGMAVFLATEAALFGSLIGTYFYLQFTSTTWPQGGIPAPSVAFPLGMTAGLVLSSVPLLFGVRAAKRGRVWVCWALILVALLMQGGYLAAQIVDYLDKLKDFTPATNAYGSIYFTMIGAHHAHVLVGMLLELFLLVRLLGGLTNYRLIAVRAVNLYWLVVNAIAIAVVLTEISPS